MVKDKFILMSPIIVLAVILIFSLTLVPSVNPTQKNLPIAFVNEDEGVILPNQTTVNMGETIATMIQETTKTADDKEPTIKWISVKNYKAAKKGLDNRKYYAALVIPKDFSQKQASLQTPNPISAEVQILVNQGMNTMASTIASQILNGFVDNMNNNVRAQLLADFEKQERTLTTKQAATLASPITKNTTNVNEIGQHSVNGNAPVSLFQPLWMASIAGALIITLALNKRFFANRKEKLVAQLIQVLIGGILAVFAGFGLTWMAGVIGIDIPNFLDIAWFVAIAFFSFYLMISAGLAWIGIKAMPLFVLILFFGAPLLAMPPEFMSTFYHDWIYSWLPMRFMVDGLRELFFFGNGLSWNQPTMVLVGIGLGSLIVLLPSALKPSLITKQDIQSDI
ncbi:YhgE/Pip domain-containing protein [Lysinibacillus sp. NPDC096418]|uniref:YhgE/Pip domain-containing protein n=1 Tax=Lysinibacillus sp. NPDC096418 TaxID=3364138 RepID=UPI003823EF29